MRFQFSSMPLPSPILTKSFGVFLWVRFDKMGLRSVPAVVAALLLATSRAAPEPEPEPARPVIQAGWNTTNLFWPGETDLHTNLTYACTYTGYVVMAEDTLVAFGACNLDPKSCNGYHALPPEYIHTAKKQDHHGYGCVAKLAVHENGFGRPDVSNLITLSCNMVAVTPPVLQARPGLPCVCCRWLMSLRAAIFSRWPRTEYLVVLRSAICTRVDKVDCVRLVTFD